MASQPGHQIAVLLSADHDFLIGEVLDHALAEAGYAVVRAASMTEAIALLDTRSDLAALVVDVEYQDNFDGWQLARHARSIDPDIAVLYIVTADPLPPGAEPVSGSRTITKPFAPLRAVAALKALLDGRDRTRRSA